MQTSLSRHGLLDDHVRFLKVKDTLKDAPIQKLAVLRIDADLYESNTDALTYRAAAALQEGGRRLPEPELDHLADRADRRGRAYWVRE